MVRLFVGYDEREAVGYHVFCSSVLRRSSVPVAFHPLVGVPEMPQTDGTNAFIYSRFLVPYLCGFEGWALFADGADMLCLSDIADLWALRDPEKAVQVVKHEYRTKSPRKYVGTVLEAPNGDYPRKNWSSLVLWNCSHPGNKLLTPGFVAQQTGSFLHRFQWLMDDQVGSLPGEWNLLVNEEEGNAKLAHFTLGIPGFPAYRGVPYADHWRRELAEVMRVG